MPLDHSFEIFDIHQHVGSTGDAHGLVHEGQKSGADLVDSEVINRLAFMDDVGIRKSVAIPGHHYNRAEGIRSTMAQNDAIARYRDANPAHFPIAVGIVEPLDQQAAVDEVVRIATELKLQAVSFHTEFQAVTMDSPWMMKILEKMFEVGLVPLLHSSNVVLHEALWRLAKVARAFPDQTIVALEPFYTFDNIQQCELIAEIAPNVLFDTASTAVIGPMIDLIRTIGADRVVFGSQYYSTTTAYGANPLTPYGKIVAQSIIATDKLSNQDKAAVLGGNGRRVFGV